MSVQHQLAVKSKNQGDVQDYRVLAYSAGPLTIDALENLYNQFSVGTMPLKARHEGESAPWITFGNFSFGDRLYTAAIRQGWTERQDGHDRPVAAMYCLSIPYEDLARSTPSYAAIYRQIPASDLFLRDNGSSLDAHDISFSDTEEQWLHIAKRIDDIGFDFCALVAALLLQSPVALLKGYDLKVEERLANLDAIAGLLPYGSRADLTLSTWMTSASSDKMRIGFTNEARPGQKRVVWSEKPSINELQGDAAQYYQMLKSIKDENHDTQKIVRFLASKKDALSFRDLVAFKDALRSMDRSNLLWKDLQTKNVPVEEVRAVFYDNGVSSMAPEKRTDLVIAMLSRLQASDVYILEQNWNSKLLAPTLAAIRSNLQYPEFQRETLELLGMLAEQRQWLPQYLDALLNTDEGPPPTSHTLELFYEGLMRLDESDLQIPERLRERLWRQPSLLYKFVFILLEKTANEASLKEWLKWLEGEEYKNNLLVFRIANGLYQKDVTQNSLIILGDADKSFVAHIVEFALHFSRKVHDITIIKRFAPAVTAWLLDNINSLDKNQEERWRSLLPEIIDVELDSEPFQIRADLLTLILLPHLEQLYLDAHLAEHPERFRSYISKFFNELYKLGPKKARVIEKLIDHCTSCFVNAQQADRNKLELLSKISSEHLSEAKKAVLATYTLDIAERHPNITLPADLKRLLTVGHGSSNFFKTLETRLRKAIHNRESTDAVAGICAELLSIKVWDKEEKILETLITSKFLDSAERIEEFLAALGKHFERYTESPAEAQERMVHFHQTLLKHQYLTINMYRQFLADKMLRQLAEMSTLIEVIGKDFNQEQGKLLETLMNNIRENVSQGEGFLNKWLSSKKR